VVWNLPVPPYDHTLRLHERNCPCWTHRGQAWQQRAKKIQGMVAHLPHHYQTVEITWVPGNERADALAGKAAEKATWSAVNSLAHMKLRVSEKFRKAKEGWHKDPLHHGTEEIPPPAEEVMYGPGGKRHSADGRTDQNRPLALRSLLQEDKEEERRQMLVLRGRGQDDQIPRPTPPPQRHAGGS
jgi:hypothetical protein